MSDRALWSEVYANTHANLEDLLKILKTKEAIVHQTQPARMDQVKNNSGGYVFQISDEAFVRRFLILGTAGGTYYASETELTLQSTKNLCEIIEKGNGIILLREIIKISLSGRAPKQNPALFALALCARYQVCDWTRTQLDEVNRTYRKSLQQLALLAVPKVCRISTHLFMFIKYCMKISGETGLTKNSKGWGRALRATVSNWYLSQDPEHLVMQVTKYRNREGYTHRDLFRLSHIHPRLTLSSSHLYWKLHTEYDAIFRFVIEHSAKSRKCKVEVLKQSMKEVKLDDNEAMDTSEQGPDENKIVKRTLAKKKRAVLKEQKKNSEAPTIETSKVLQFLDGFKCLQQLSVDEVDKAVALIMKHGFVREHIPVGLLNSKDIWRALLTNMPMTAMIRNLSKMTAIGVLGSGQEQRDWNLIVVNKLLDKEALKSARIHPVNLLLAYATYKNGKGHRGKLRWEPSKMVVDALEQAFYKSFQYVTPTNKRYCLALDVSGSMASYVSGAPLSCSMAAAAFSMTFVRTESHVTAVAFSDVLIPVAFHREMDLEAVLQLTDEITMGSTDCSLPMVWALQKNLPFDVFIVFTDNETYFGNIHPFVALQKYRTAMNIPDSKLIVMAMTGTKFSIADPNDLNMLDISGLDSSVPELVSEFVSGNLC
ncbi:unnamed protein product [Thelazia callipaeda]|uniref:TROVE domain-containing protein n=1 Tax=Thelazia callipaeda TaxID=103827 RepID=A0A0N5D8L9_THECL|nr:unnamed protein product [Thelazia callipaeda]